MNRRRFLSHATLAAAATTLPLEAQRPESAPVRGPLPPSIAALKSRKDEAKPITVAERADRIARAKK